MHIAILMTNTDESAFAQRHPKDGEKFQNLLRPLRPEWQYTVFAVKDGIFPDDLHKFDGLIITGSPASVHDNKPWIDRLLTCIRQAHAEAIPMYGACFGHQAIALALGGNVEPNPSGWVFGRVDTQLQQPWDQSASDYSLYAAHIEQVTKLPKDAVVSGVTDNCAIASFAIGNTIWTTQYHPEMTPEFVAALVDEYAPKLPADVAAKARSSLKKPAHQDAIATAIIRFFEFAVSNTDAAKA